MKLLLTSGGIANKTIENELKELIGKDDFKGIKMLFCITASNYEGGEMNDWLIKDLEIVKNKSNTKSKLKMACFWYKFFVLFVIPIRVKEYRQIHI